MDRTIICAFMLRLLQCIRRYISVDYVRDTQLIFLTCDRRETGLKQQGGDQDSQQSTRLHVTPELQLCSRDKHTLSPSVLCSNFKWRYNYNQLQSIIIITAAT